MYPASAVFPQTSTARIFQSLHLCRTKQQIRSEGVGTKFKVLQPCPVLSGKSQQYDKMEEEEEGMEAAMEEQPLGEAPPVHCPLVQELPTHVK